MTWKTWIAAPALALAACGGDGETQPAAGPANALPAEPGNESETGAAAPANGDEGDAGADRGTDGTGTEPDMAWVFARSAAGPKLTYGEPETDNTRLMLRCGEGDAIVMSFLRGHASGGPSEIMVASGGESATVPATVSESELLNGLIVEAELPASSPPLGRFRGGAAMRVEWGRDTIRVPAAGAEAERFFAAC